MKGVVVLQTRTSSSRLPAKALLHLAGYPLVLLAAKRAANSGRQVIVATSDDSTDDHLASIVKQSGVSCVRGDLDDTLGRFIFALNGYHDEQIVIRLTGDNVFPDGPFIDEVEAYFREHDLNYLSTTGEASGLPYGLSVEVTRLRWLREAHNQAHSLHDREHVTPYIVRKFGAVVYDAHSELQLMNWRCTIDTLDDYVHVASVFQGISDPISVTWKELVAKLKSCGEAPIARHALTSMVIGGAQLGMDYGLTNQTGKPRQVTVKSMLRAAIGSGVKWVDTARVYGESESNIGSALGKDWHGRVSVITKLGLLESCPNDASDKVVNAFVDASINESCLSLRVSKLDVCLLHRVSMLNSWGGAVWRRLRDLQTMGRISTLGVSVQSPSELRDALNNEGIEHVQLPYNILDNRWDSVLSDLKALKRSRSFVVHVRSVYLQGLLLSGRPEDWIKAHCTEGEAGKIIHWLQETAVDFSRQNVADLCLAFVRSQDWVDGVVIGMETFSQLKSNAQLFGTPTMKRGELELLQRNRPHLQERTLNPADWLAK